MKKELRKMELIATEVEADNVKGFYNAEKVHTLCLDVHHLVALARLSDTEAAELRDMLRNNNEVYREETGRLRERVAELEGTLRKCLTYLTTTIDGMRRRYPELIPEAGLVEEALEEEVRAALSPVSAKTNLETRSEEEEAKP